jgi:hypothetical protein
MALVCSSGSFDTSRKSGSVVYSLFSDAGNFHGAMLALILALQRAQPTVDVSEATSPSWTYSALAELRSRPLETVGYNPCYKSVLHIDL